MDGAGLVSCALGALPPERSATVTISAVLDPGFTGSLSNSATVTSETPDPTATNNTSSTTGTAAPSADLTVSKTVTPTRPVPGQRVTYLLSVRNLGPSTATEVSVSDQVAPELTDVTAQPSVGTCSVSAEGRVLCGLGGLPPGASATVTVSGSLDLAYTGTLTNAATAASPTPDPDDFNNRASVSAVVAPSADVSITKTLSPSNPVAGDLVTFTLTVRSSGPSLARAVTVSDSLDPGLLGAVVDSSVGTCSATGPEVSCALGELAPAATPVLITIIARVAPDFTGTLTNAATVATTTDDPNPVNDTAIATGGSTSSADLSIVKTVSPTAPVPGSAVTFTLLVSNDGPSTATQVVLTDRVSPVISAVTAVADSGRPCTLDGGSVTCTLGALRPTDQVVVTISGTLSPDSVGQISNTATISASTSDPDPTNNSATVSALTAPSADVRVTKSLEPARPVPGRPVAYTVRANNAGPSTAVDVRVVDNVSAALTGVVAVTDRGTCSVSSTNRVTCAAGDLGPSTSAQITISGTLDPAFTGTLPNTASASSVTADPNLADNSASAEGASAPTADLSIDKRIQPTTPVPGEPVTFVLAVVNAGPSTAAAATLIDQLDPALLGATVSTTSGACAVDLDNLVTCALGALAPDAETRVTVRATVSPGFVGTLSNSAAVGSPTPDPDLSDNTDTVTGTAAPAADLAVTKTLGPANPVAGQAVTFTLTVDNLGPSTAVGVRLVDDLAPSLRDVQVQTSTGSCTIDPEDGLVCLLGVLPPAQDPLVVTVTAVLAPDAAGVLANTGTVTSSTVDPDDANNAATVSGAITRSADLALTKTLTPATLVPGEPLTYTLTVDNLGPSSATGVMVTDQLDPALEGIEVTTTSGTCSVVDALLRCVVGSVAPGDPLVVITVQAALSADHTGTLVNVATVATTTPDPDAENDTAGAVGAAVPSADLVIAKAVSPDLLVPGEQVTYTLTVVNHGPSTATEVTVQDPLDEALLEPVVDTSVGSCRLDDTTVLCDLGALRPDADPVVITVRATLAPGTTGAVTNTATVSSATPDPDPDDTAIVVTEVGPRSDLSIRKTAEDTVVVPGGRVTYTLTVDTAGPSTAADVTVTDELDPSLGSVTAEPSRGTCEPVDTDGVLVCALGALAPGDGPVQITVSGVVDPGYAQDELSNTATVASPTDDPDLGNNTSTVTLPTNPGADLSLTKTLVSPRVVAGQPVEYRIVVRNGGPSQAPAVVVTDRLPVQLVDAIGTTQTGTCARPDAGRRLVCEIGDLAPGAEAVVIVTATVSPNSTGDIVNTAVATSDVPDPDGTDPTDTVVAGVVDDTDVGVTKTVSAPRATVGDVLTYTLRVTASGPSVAYDVVLTDRLPAGLTLVADPVGAGTCSVRGAQVTCALGDLDVGQTATVRLRARVGAILAGTEVTNAATVRNLHGDRDATNDTDRVSTRVAGLPLPPPPAESPRPDTPSTLPWTGGDFAGELRLALGLLISGLLMTISARRSRHSQHHLPSTGRQ